MSMEDLETALEHNLTKRAFRAVNQVWLLGDVENVRSYLKNKPMIKKGSLDPEEIISIFSLEAKAPSWLERYMKDFPSEEQRIENSNSLSHYCLIYAPKEALHSSIADLLTLEYTCRLILEKARRENLRLPAIEEKEFLKEPLDTWPEQYQHLHHIWNKNKNSPVELEKEIAEWRFSVLDTMRNQASPFSLDRLIFSIALFDFIESRRPLTDETKKASQERIIQAVCNDNY